MHKARTQPEQRYDSEAYNAGWISGYDSLIVDLHEGFGGRMPKLLLSLIGGKKAVAQALGSTATEEIDETELEVDYELGANEGYSELLEEIEEAYKQKKIEIPAFMQKIIDGP
jgi:hypothetical protein